MQSREKHPSCESNKTEQFGSQKAREKEFQQLSVRTIPKKNVQSCCVENYRHRIQNFARKNEKERK